MTIGTGIFLAACVASLTALLYATRQKWKWKWLVFYPLAALLLLVGIGAGLFFGLERGYFGPKKIGRETSYAGVSLGQTKADVLFALGKPERIGDGPAGTFLYDSGPNHWPLLVSFDDSERVDGAWSVQFDRPSSWPIELKTLNRDTDLESATRILGKPDQTVEYDGGIRRAFYFSAHNIRLDYEKGNLTGIGIQNHRMKPTESAAVPGKPNEGTAAGSAK
jgi:hypothetical protein